MKNTTTGDLYWVACPYCEKPIRDLWDSSLSQGDVIDCEHCERKVTVQSVETVTYLTLATEDE